MKLDFCIGLLLSLLPLAAQTTGKAEVFSAKDIKAQLASLAPQAKASGDSSSVLGDYKTHSLRLSARTTSGGGEVHQHFDDVMVVTEGNGDSDHGRHPGRPPHRKRR